MSATIIIPARLGSTRFPGKVLADRTGRPLIRHVYEAASRARGVERVVVATDDDRVRRGVAAFGGHVVMTRPDHPNGTSRLAEAAAILGLPPDAVVVNVQGDEPEIEPAVIEAAAAALVGGSAPVATVACPLSAGEDAANPSIVKVVRRLDGTALYFSRALIPFPRDGVGLAPLKHAGIYAYRRSFLDTYTRLIPTELELTEHLEQLRVLAHGFAIAVAVVESAGHAGIDTPEQYEAFVERWRRRG
ncbi:MAG: 3-deoxy-manno-octulosonate cytidylyltransferase [Phycisphaerales bacterium]|nr:3-deoxy-manno-octulosonate cytidylyltransferase [Phycisphaerales bacterium]